MQPKAIAADKLHEQSRSFTPEALDKFEATKAWKNHNFVWVTPLSDGMIHYDVWSTWQSVQPTMNSATTGQIVTMRMEVGEAYNFLFKIATDREFARANYANHEGFLNLIDTCEFVLTTEHDNVLPPNLIPDLFAAIYTCPDCGEEVGGAEWTCRNGHHGFDAVSGLYFTKTDPPNPMAYGDPADPNDFRPRSVKAAVANGEVIEVNGLAMGAGLWRKGLFSKVSQPWFVTSPGATQDLAFARKAKAEAGARFGVHCGVKVGHRDYRTGRTY